MAEPLTAQSPLHVALPSGRHGHNVGPAGLRVRVRDIGGAISLAARVDGTAALAVALGWDPPAPRRLLRVNDGLVLWTGPERWLILSATDIEAEMRVRVGGTGAVADQSDSRIVLDLTGPRLRDALVKGVSIDLHPRALTVGEVAATLAAHIPVLLWQEEADQFSIAVARSFAHSLAEWLRDSSLEYGFEVA